MAPTRAAGERADTAGPRLALLGSQPAFDLQQTLEFTVQPVDLGHRRSLNLRVDRARRLLRLPVQLTRNCPDRFCDESATQMDAIMIAVLELQVRRRGQSYDCWG
ncbi:hypothetical protein ACVILL_006456 [Bradyrhizobium sp. USDA 3364]